LFWKLYATSGKNRNSRRRFDDVVTSTDDTQDLGPSDFRFIPHQGHYMLLLNLLDLMKVGIEILVLLWSRNRTK
jgi:hypothetical protein